jgi:hypothetical protein
MTSTADADDVFVTVGPRGWGHDDTASIQNALDACPKGKTVELAAGEFIIKRPPLRIPKGVMLRGVGFGDSVLQVEEAE